MAECLDEILLESSQVVEHLRTEVMVSRMQNSLRTCILLLYNEDMSVWFHRIGHAFVCMYRIHYAL